MKTFGDLRTATLRAATWDSGAHVIVFPPFTEYPDLHMISKVPPKDAVAIPVCVLLLHVHVHVHVQRCVACCGHPLVRVFVYGPLFWKFSACRLGFCTQM